MTEIHDISCVDREDKIQLYNSEIILKDINTRTTNKKDQMV